MELWNQSRLTREVYDHSVRLKDKLSKTLEDQKEQKELFQELCKCIKGWLAMSDIVKFFENHVAGRNPA